MQLAVSSFYNTDSVITLQDSSQVRLGTINAPVLKIATYVSGTKGAQRRATQLSFNTNGTTNLSDISNARVFYTGGSPNFDSSFQYGSTVSAPNGAFSVSGNQPLMVGVNYFWLTYDVSNSSGAAGNFIDAECTQLVDSFIYNSDLFLRDVTLSIF